MTGHGITARLTKPWEIVAIFEANDDALDLFQQGTEPQNLIVGMCYDQNRSAKIWKGGHDLTG